MAKKTIEKQSFSKPSSKKKILVVDDEKDITESLIMLLDNEGYKVTAVNSGKEALQLLQKEKFDLVLLDILMPEMSGNEVGERIRKNPKTKDQKIVFLTVVTLGEAGKAMIHKLKPVDYIQKPFSTADFRNRIKKLLVKNESH